LAQQVGARGLHSPFYTCPLRAGCPVTVTVHDATFFTEPEHYEKSRRTFFRSAIKTSLRRTERVIVPSKATRDELIRLLGADPASIDVAYHGVDPAAFHAPTADEKARVRARLGLGESTYVAFLGAKEPRKNVPNLIRGWAVAAADRERPPALVIAGGQGHDDDIDHAVTSVPPNLRLLRPGYLRFGDLPGYLGGAMVAAYPSYGEGFGLPVLEAMACGTPVVALDRGAVREIVDDGVTGVVFSDLEQMTQELSSVLALDRRRVREQAVARFGVARMVSEYIAVYRRLVEARRGPGS
jgi:glycosyltransferase involved in cell wall biosynthesis